VLSRDGAFSLKRLCGEGLGKKGAPSLGTLEDMCKKGCGYEHLSPWGPL